MVYSTDLSKAVVLVLVLLFGALWFILRGVLLYVLHCAILFLCFSVLLALRLPRLGKRELILVLFVRLIDLCLFGFVGFLFLLMSGKGCGLWLWHSLDFSLTFFEKHSPQFLEIHSVSARYMLLLTITGFRVFLRLLFYGKGSRQKLFLYVSLLLEERSEQDQLFKTIERNICFKSIFILILTINLPHHYFSWYEWHSEVVEVVVPKQQSKLINP